MRLGLYLSFIGEVFVEAMCNDGKGATVCKEKRTPDSSCGVLTEGIKSSIASICGPSNSFWYVRIGNELDQISATFDIVKYQLTISQRRYVPCTCLGVLL